MATARREHFGSLLEPGLDEIFHDVYNQYPSLIDELFTVEQTDEPFIEDQAIGSMGGFEKFDGQVNYETMYEQYRSLYEFPEYTNGFRIERKLYDDDKYNIINKRPAGLAISAQRFKEKYGASIFNNAADPDYPGPDGKPLCAIDHPTKTPGGPEERRNADVLELNHDNLWEVVSRMRKTKDDRGEIFPVIPTTLLVPEELHETAWKLITADHVIEQSDENPNIHQGRLKLVTWPYLDDPDSWFVMDDQYRQMFLRWFDKQPVEFAMEEDFNSLVAQFRAYMRFAAGWSDWFFIYGCSPNWSEHGVTEA